MMENQTPEDEETRKTNDSTKKDDAKKDKRGWWTFTNLDTNIKVTMIGVFGVVIAVMFRLGRNDNSMAASIWKVTYEQSLKDRAADKIYFERRLDMKDDQIQQVRHEKDSIVGVAHKENIDLAIMAGFRKALNEINNK